MIIDPLYGIKSLILIMFRKVKRIEKTKKKNTNKMEEYFFKIILTVIKF